MTKTAPPKPIPASALEYRPRDYFGRYDLQAKLLSTVKGRVKRALLKDALESGEITKNRHPSTHKGGLILLRLGLVSHDVYQFIVLNQRQTDSF